MSRPFRYVGRSVPRVEDPELLTAGPVPRRVRAARALDVAFVRSPYAHALLVGIRADAARALDDVALVVTGDQVGEAPEIVTGSSRPEAGTWRRPLLARDRVRYVGEPVAADRRLVTVRRRGRVRPDRGRLRAAGRRRRPRAGTHGRCPAAPRALEQLRAHRVRARRRGRRLRVRRRGRGEALPLRADARGAAGRPRRHCRFVARPDVLVVHANALPRPLHAGRLSYGLPETHVRVLVPGRRRGIGAQGAPLRRGGNPPVSLSRLAGAPVKWAEDRYEHPRGERPLEGGRLRPSSSLSARTVRSLLLRGRLGRRRRSASRTPRGRA